MIIRHHPTDGLKGQQLIAQGIALGIIQAHIIPRPEGAKALLLKAFALSGREFLMPFVPRALPWAMFLLPLRGAPFNAIITLPWAMFLLPLRGTIE